MTPADLHNRLQIDYPHENWDGECAGVCYYVCRVTGTVRRAYASATDARRASVIVSTDPNAAPAGAFHHWSYRATINGITKDWGHVAASFGGGWALMSNPEAWDEQWGIALGVTHVSDWTARRRGIVTYLGWSHTYGENTASITMPAPASTPNPTTIPKSGEIEMPWIAVVKSAVYYLIIPQGGSKPRAVPLGSEGYRIPMKGDDSSFAKLPRVNFDHPDAVAALKVAVDGIG
ncbi:hypothetical protein [uncultured Microbacterium sp.]|uniref:hypothetical protein n=1 Tax=uncultured Microbacterium sp. TaxID=191216 RepID=UPI0025D6CF68|nr:hypothetical protein [uncultured Microbacterium sp.]